MTAIHKHHLCNQQASEKKQINKSRLPYQRNVIKEDNFLANLLRSYARGFSLLELLFALIILSFGLTALVQTHFSSASTLKNAQERYHALLIAQQYMNHALVSNDLDHISEKILRNNVWYFVNQRTNQIESEKTQITIEVRWRQLRLTLSSHHFSFL